MGALCYLARAGTWEGSALQYPTGNAEHINDTNALKGSSLGFGWVRTGWPSRPWQLSSCITARPSAAPHPASLQAGGRPTSHCTCPFSPRHVRLGRLSPRRRAWSRRRRARRGRVSVACVTPLASPQAFLTPPFPRSSPRGTPSGPSLPHPEAPVQAALRRSIPCPEALQRVCRAALGTRE
jgi:hypothetical protein